MCSIAYLGWHYNRTQVKLGRVNVLSGGGCQVRLAQSQRRLGEVLEFRFVLIPTRNLELAIHLGQAINSLHIGHWHIGRFFQ
jgi:hypothetical protein